jgi:uncharacterized protein
MKRRGLASLRRRIRTTLLAAVFLAGTGLLPRDARAAEVPYLAGRVVDDARILSPAARERIEATLSAHEEHTGNQVAVLTVPSLGNESIEEYAVKVFSTWKLGRKGQDNGVLLVVAPEEHRMRIEVGYGLEATLPDSTAGSILRAELTPRFKTGDFDGGVEAGVAAILAVLEGRGSGGESSGSASGEAPPPAAKTGGGFNEPDLPWVERILIGAFIFGIIGLFTVVGVMTPGAGWFLYVFLIPFWAMFPIVVIGAKPTLAVLAAYLVGFPIAKLSIRSSSWYLKAAQDLKSKGSASIGGMTITSGGSGSSSESGGFSGGGFSGGGGSSGGGGASGSW